MINAQIGLENLLKALKSRGQLPVNMDASKVGDRYWFVCHDENQSQIISESSTTGFSDDPSIALLKSLSERAERSAFRSGFSNKIESCMTERSDGFAAYPTFYDSAKTKARESALSEAIERYVWSTWWDNKNIAFKIESITALAADLKINPYVSLVKEQCHLEEIFVIKPEVKNLHEQSVIILFGRSRFGSFISGGASGKNLDLKNTMLRSIDELYRHGLAINKIRTTNAEPKTFYEKRLAYFGLGHGNQLIRERLESKGAESIVLPNLAVDKEIAHEIQDLFIVYRCLFENQPPFIGGALERLCL